MKKRFVWMLALLLTAALAGCGSGENAAPAGESEDDAGEVLYDPVLYEDLSSTLVSLGQYKGLEAEFTVAEITDEEVADQVWSIQKNYAELVEADRPAQERDLLTIDFTGYVDGETSENLQGEGTSLEIGSGDFVPGFEEQLIGASAGDDVEVNLTFPEE
ncbi:MAG: FKBP-type peptidyl-prolyl cis-trans isomerase [Eubacteriales bacterium]|nr:FKBP-type peptidyl-prolyl cis-trans isomerase [Eubacteriales bacterium]